MDNFYNSKEPSLARSLFTVFILSVATCQGHSSEVVGKVLLVELFRSSSVCDSTFFLGRTSSILLHITPCLRFGIEAIEVGKENCVG